MSAVHSNKSAGRVGAFPAVSVRTRRRKMIEMIAWGILGGVITSLLLAICLYLVAGAQ